VLHVRDRARDGREVARILSGLPALAAELDPSPRAGELAVTIGIGPELWDTISPKRRPAGLRPFREMEAGGRLI